jgi:hypothetical protein
LNINEHLRTTLRIRTQLVQLPVDSNRKIESFPYQYLADYITTIDLCVLDKRHNICGAQGQHLGEMINVVPTD